MILIPLYWIDYEKQTKIKTHFPVNNVCKTYRCCDIIAIMKSSRFILSILALVMIGAPAHADDADRIAQLTQLYDATRSVCGAVSDELQHLKNMTTGGAVVSGVGTVAAGGALYAGISKSQIDKEIERLQQQICDAGGCTVDGVQAMSDSDFLTKVIQPMSEIAALQRQLADATKKSIRMGNWRTGLMAGATATNITSAVLSGINHNQSDLIQQITACNNAIDMVANADVSGLNPMENPVVSKLNSIKTWCHGIDVRAIETFEKQQTIAMGTSIAGAVTGATGTVTSAVANSPTIRDNNTDAGRKKEKKLNTTANVMAGTTTVLGGVSTGFNIASINKINKIIKQAKLCEEVF